MDNEYIRENKIVDKTDAEKDLELIISIIKTKSNLTMLYSKVMQALMLKVKPLLETSSAFVLIAWQKKSLIVTEQ